MYHFQPDLASGSSIDWVYGTQNVNLTYTFEFRDKGSFIILHLIWKNVRTSSNFLNKNQTSIGRYGFLLPPKQIIPNSLEVIDGLIAMTKEAKTLKYL